MYKLPDHAFGAAPLHIGRADHLDEILKNGRRAQQTTCTPGKLFPNTAARYTQGVKFRKILVQAQHVADCRKQIIPVAGAKPAGSNHGDINLLILTCPLRRNGKVYHFADSGLLQRGKRRERQDRGYWAADPPSHGRSRHCDNRRESLKGSKMFQVSLKTGL